MYRIGSGAGFSGDRVDAPQSVVAAIAAAGEGGAIMFETMGERTLALGQLARRRDPHAGYEPLLEAFLGPVLATCLANRILIVGNFGCANPPAAAGLIAAMAKRQGLALPRIAIVEGDDVTTSLDLARAERWDGDGRLREPQGSLIALNVYLGAHAIADAIRDGAEIVVTGRVADPALAVGPLVAHFGWDWADLDRIAAATLAGHLLECGAQVSGGYFADPGFKDVPDPDNIGFPIAEVEADGSFVVTKARGHRRLRRPAHGQGTAPLRDPRSRRLSHPRCHPRPDWRDARSGRRPTASPFTARVALRRLKSSRRPPAITATGSARPRSPMPARTRPPAPASPSTSSTSGCKRRAIAVTCRGDIIGLASAFDSDDGALRRTAMPSGDDLRVRFAFSCRTRRRCAPRSRKLARSIASGPAGGGGIRQAVRPRIETRSYLLSRADVRPAHSIWEPGA